MCLNSDDVKCKQVDWRKSIIAVVNECIGEELPINDIILVWNEERLTADVLSSGIYKLGTSLQFPLKIYTKLSKHASSKLL